jgi:cyanophycinase
MAGWLALAGGAEFQPGCEDADRMLVDAAGGAGARVAILPTAAAAEGAPGIAAANGVRHFNRLGAHAFGVMIVDTATANDATLAAQLAFARLIYMAGGDPGYLLRSLKGSLAWRVMLDAWSEGAVLAGSSAGAMVLCEAMWNPATRRIEPGLAVVKRAAVIPHHRPASGWAGQLHRELDQVFSILGIPEQTSLIWNGSTWQVAGPGDVTIYFREQTVIHHNGDRFTLGVFPQVNVSPVDPIEN